MGMNKRRHGNGERDTPPGRPSPEDPRLVARQGGDGEGRQYPPVPGQAELFPAPAGTAAGQRLLF